MSFAWPWALGALVLVPLAALGYVLLGRRRLDYAVRFTNLPLLAEVVARTPGWRRHVPPALALLALAALVVGFARPQRTEHVPRQGGTVVLTVDVSGSMKASDVRPTRMAAAREAANRFVERLPERFQVGVVQFSTSASVLLTPTRDRAAARSAIDGLRADGGTALGDAIRLSVRTGLNSPEVRRIAAERRRDGGRPPVAVLLLSDGKSTQGSPVDRATARAKAAGVPVYTVALGTANGTVEVIGDDGFPVRVNVPPDEPTLRMVAASTGGRFFSAQQGGELNRIYEELGTRVGYDARRQDLAYLFAGIGGVLLLASGTLSALWFGRFP